MFIHDVHSCMSSSGEWFIIVEIVYEEVALNRESLPWNAGLTSMYLSVSLTVRSANTTLHR